MDFVSGHHGAIPGSAMKSPGQFEHPLVARAKCEITTAALANGVVPSHNVTTELKDIDIIRNDARAPERIRLSAHVEHSPQPDHAHRRSHAPGLFRGTGSARHPHRRPGQGLGADRSTLACCTTAPPTAITGTAGTRPRHRHADSQPRPRVASLPELLPDPLPILYRDEHHRSSLTSRQVCLFIARNRSPRNALRHPDVARPDWSAGLAGTPLGPRHIRHPVVRPERRKCQRAGQAIRGRHSSKNVIWAVVRGYPPSEGIIDHPLTRQRDPYEFRGAQSSMEPQDALTHFRKLAEWSYQSRSTAIRAAVTHSLELEPVTGRRHQLRRHLKHIAHPIIGDATHGKGKHNRFLPKILTATAYYWPA
jgi:tRNA pseudouridine65 synthase